ncbi:hypothetical protein DITRI_Ditri02bG0156300 [Diplodiscus trichospermus]
MKYNSPILYQSLCFLLLFLSFQPTLSSFSSAKKSCSDDESAALFQFKSLFSIIKTASNSENCEYEYGTIPYPKTNSWKEGTDCCLWDGVSCDKITGHVISVDLSCSWLSGTLPSNSTLFLLSHLQRLDLSFNDFRKSQISSSFGRFASLTHLHLSESSFSGPVPYEISHLSKLVSLHLFTHSASDISGFPEYEGSLKLEKSTLTGIVQNLTKVREIIFDGIDMSLADPNSFQNLSYAITTLSLTYCDLRGKFPDNILNLQNLKTLSLDFNPSLIGQFPKSNWTSPLELLDTSMTSFFGELPESIGNLKSLRGLGFVSCNLSGSVPNSLGTLSQLTFLFLPYNNFSGKIPSSLTNLTQLRLLQMCCNHFEGSIPDNPNAFPNLRFIHFSDNSLTGTTPSWLYSHPSLNFIDLGNNQLIGHISEFQYSILDYINLKNNSFEGSIPSSIAKLVNLTFLDFSSNRLNGTVSLDMFSKLQKLTWLYLSSNSLTLISNNSLNYVLPNLEYVGLKSCNITQFPSFLKGSKALKSLDLSNNELTGVISDKCNLKVLDYVDLSSNHFSEFFCFLEGSKNLTSLDLSNNRIHGQISKIPWKDIQFLDLHSNFIQGDLPALPRDIKFLSISNNNFVGEISDICNLRFLEILDLSHNNFSGFIPQCIGSFSQSLSLLNLKMNNFRGIIPSTFSKECRLKNLNLDSNHLEGPLTGSISNCEDLEVLDLGNNKINSTFPRWIEVLSELQVLVLRSNKFHGSIGISKNTQSLQRLRIIDLSNNNFSGPLPTSYIRNFRGMMNLDKDKAMRYMGERNYTYDYSVALVVKGFQIELVKILTIFTSIDLSNNNFEGEIPKTFGELTSLRGLNLSHNNLVGHIPVSLRNLTQFEWLDLSWNKLGGQIPCELVDLTFLSFFDVSYNQLVGAIPHGKQFNTFENGSYEGNEGLCGLPLSKSCRSNEPEPPPPLMDSNDDSKLEFGWKVVLIGYGFGFILGVGVGCVALQMGKPKWIVTLIN